jgi:hypothetical protein
VSFDPYLNELNQHFRGQQVFTFWAQGNPGYRRVKLKTEIPHVTLVGPSKVYVPDGKWGESLMIGRFYRQGQQPQRPGSAVKRRSPTLPA